MEHFQHADGNSITGTIITLVFLSISFTDVEGLLKVLAILVTIIAGATTAWYNVVKINKAKKEKTLKDE